MIRSRLGALRSATVRRLCVALMAAASAGAVLPAQPAPDLTALLARAGVTAPVSASCRGEFRPGHPADYAAALGAAPDGRYIVLQDDGQTQELASFAGKADLSCYTVREADRLNDTIAQSTTMNGRVVAEWDGAVVCGFIEPTIALCWQYAPEARKFVRIGGWTT